MKKWYLLLLAAVAVDLQGEYAQPEIVLKSNYPSTVRLTLYLIATPLYCDYDPSQQAFYIAPKQPTFEARDILNITKKYKQVPIIVPSGQVMSYILKILPGNRSYDPEAERLIQIVVESQENQNNWKHIFTATGERWTNIEYVQKIPKTAVGPRCPASALEWDRFFSPYFTSSLLTNSYAQYEITVHKDGTATWKTR